MTRLASLLLTILALATIAACAARAEVVSLDGTWQAEAVPEARGDTIPAAFTRSIPVPGHWPLMKPVVKDNMSDALWCRTTWKAPSELPPRVTLRIGKASFGTTMFVNGKKAGFFPYNFVASETEIRPFLKPGVENEIVVRLGNAWLQNGKGWTMAHSGCDPERFHYYQGITDSVTLLLSSWPAVRRLETRADLEAGVVNVRATVQNGSADAVPLTHWESLQGDKKPWVKIDFGAERDVKECKVQWSHIWKPPTKWRISPALPARTRYVLIEIDDISPNKLASIEEIEIH